MKDILTVFFKEMRRFFTDKRTLAALFVPGIVIFVLYTILGNVITSQVSSIQSAPENTPFTVLYTDNFADGQEKPYIIETLESTMALDGKNNTISIEAIPFEQVESAKDDVASGKADLLFVFSDDFETNVLSGGKSGENSIALFYDAEESTSSYLYSLASSLVSVCYNDYVVNIVDGSYQDPNLGEGDYAVNMMLSFVFPMITIALLFSTILTICPESIAGEKERGTMASLLLTPVKRSHIALGKILALSVTALASGFVSFLGILLSLPELFGGEIDFFSIFTAKKRKRTEKRIKALENY